MPKIAATKSYQQLPRFPSSERDIAIVVDEGFLCGVFRTLFGAPPIKLWSSCIVFDLYRGKQVDSGKEVDCLSARLSR